MIAVDVALQTQRLLVFGAGAGQLERGDTLFSDKWKTTERYSL